MSISSEQIEILTDQYIIGLYQEMEQEVIADIARRVKGAKRYTETAELMAKAMVGQGYSAAQIRKDVMRVLNADQALQSEIARNTKEYKAYVKKIIQRTVKNAQIAGEKLVAEAGTMAWNDDLSMWQQAGVNLKKPNTLSSLNRAYIRQTAGKLRNLTRSTGFQNTPLGYTGILNSYRREMDLALIKVASGTFSYDVAVNNCIRRLANSGLRTVDYESGRKYQLDTAVRMCVRTGVSQLAGRITEENLKQTGQDLVLTSQHIGSRPEHVPWQNRIFSYSGKSKKYPGLSDGTGYGSPSGLKGVNCTHEFYPYWEGITRIPEDMVEPDPVEINGKRYTVYEASQKQRQMERGIRATRREIEAQKSIGGDTEDLRSVLKKQMKDYRDFSERAGLRPKENRLKVISGTSDLKRTRAYKRRVQDKIPSQTGKMLGGVDYGKAGEAIQYFGDQIRTAANEHAIVIAADGMVYQFAGGSDNVEISGINLKGAYITHNHPESEGIVSFGKNDFDFLKEYPDIKELCCVNSEYNYRIKALKDLSEVSYNELYVEALKRYKPSEDLQDLAMRILDERGYVEYDKKRFKS